MRRIAVLTSGGDAPGMNAAIGAVVRQAIHEGMSVYGVERGYNGLVRDNLTLMERRSVSDIIHRGGTILKTARCDEFNTIEGQAEATKVLREHDIDALVVIGGDGSMRGARDIAKNFDIPVIAIPATIDNDLNYTDYTIGFDTAVNTVLSAINNLRDTMTSHDRVSVIEVMGRKCGDLAVYAGLAGGAEHILVPEMPVDLDAVAKELNQSYLRDKTSDFVIVAEGVGTAEEICKKLGSKTTVPLRATVLGHIQRGGMPTMADRVLAARLGVHAIKTLKEGRFNRAVGIVNNQMIDVDIEEALNAKSNFNPELYNIADVLSL
ncbi:MAG: 6-phosphofructokinase [Clostridia bacterium]|nr:6-phosphofructokinase [Clostridia bacterium]